MEKVKINSRQFAILVILYTIGTTILIAPSSMAGQAKQDAWLAAIFGLGASLLLVTMYNALGKLMPGLTLVEMMEKLLGRWIGKVVALSFIYLTVVTAGELLYIVGEFMVNQIMPETPLVAISILFVTIVIFGVRLGIESISRSAEIFFPVFLLLFIVLVVFVSPQIKFQNIEPVFEVGILPIIAAALHFISIFCMSAVVLLMIYPSSTNQPEAARRAFYKGLVIGGIVLIIIIMLSILVLGASSTARHLYPSYLLGKKINIGNFLQRIEAIMGIMWIITIYFKMTLYVYASVTGLAQILKLKEKRALTLPLGMLLVVISMIVHPDVIHSYVYDKKIWPPYVATYGVVLPLILLVIAKLRQLKQK